MNSLAQGLAGPPRRRARIALTPLIDVVFILLIFFMLTSSFIDQRAITLDAPASATTATDTDNPPLMIDLTPNGEQVGGTVLAAPALEALIRQTLAEQPGRAIKIRPHPGVPVQHAVSLIDRLSAWGVADIALVPGS